ncbi:MAG: hypothetical protein KAU20_01175 [Nanoarchaeota archaeon]|nr:hypothetical protein [Nanoarchaeota archaeon]
MIDIKNYCSENVHGNKECMLETDIYKQLKGGAWKKVDRELYNYRLKYK